MLTEQGAQDSQMALAKLKGLPAGLGSPVSQRDHRRHMCAITSECAGARASWQTPCGRRWGCAQRFCPRPAAHKQQQWPVMRLRCWLFWIVLALLSQSCGLCTPSVVESFVHIKILLFSGAYGWWDAVHVSPVDYLESQRMGGAAASCQAILSCCPDSRHMPTSPVPFGIGNSVAKHAPGSLA